MWWSPGVSRPNAQPRFVDDPQRSANGFGLEQAPDRDGDMANARQSLIAQADHDDSGRGLGWMLDHVGEAAIERDRNAAFAYCHSEKSIVGSAHELFVASKCDVVAGLAERCSNRSQVRSRRV